LVHQTRAKFLYCMHQYFDSDFVYFTKWWQL